MAINKKLHFWEKQFSRIKPNYIEDPPPVSIVKIHSDETIENFNKPNKQKLCKKQ